MHQIFFHTPVCWWKAVLANYYLIIYPYVSIIHGMQFCDISDNSMARITLLTANNSNTESHTSRDEFLQYFHYKHWWQNDEKLALKHHSSLKKTSAIYFYKHMQNPSIPSCSITGGKKYNVQKSHSISLIPAFEKNPSSLLGSNMGSGFESKNCTDGDSLVLETISALLVDSLKCVVWCPGAPVTFDTTSSSATPDLAPSVCAQLTDVSFHKLLYWNTSPYKADFVCVCVLQTLS